MPLRIKQLKACSLTLHVSRMHYLFSDFKRKCCSISLQVLGLGVILKWDDVRDLLSHIALSENWKCVDKNSYDTTNFFVVRKPYLTPQFILKSSVFILKNAWSHRNWKTCSLTFNSSILTSQFFHLQINIFTLESIFQKLVQGLWNQSNTLFTTRLLALIAITTYL